MITKMPTMPLVPENMHPEFRADYIRDDATIYLIRIAVAEGKFKG